MRLVVETCDLRKKVVMLEEEWADYLVSVGQMDQAINHYLEAGQYPRAIESAVASKQWTKAVNIVEGMENDVGRKYYKQIAHHYEEVSYLQRLFPPKNPTIYNKYISDHSQ